MAEIKRVGFHERPMLPPPNGEKFDDNVGPHFAHHWLDHGFLAWPFNMFWKKHPNGLFHIIICTDEIGERVQRATNYADNASQMPNPDNVLNVDYDNKTYIDLLNNALIDAFQKVGKMCKHFPQCYEGEDIRFTVALGHNMDENTLQPLAHTIQQYIVSHIVRDWLVMRNSDMAQNEIAAFDATSERLSSLVNWRREVEHKRLNPLL